MKNPHSYIERAAVLAVVCAATFFVFNLPIGAQPGDEARWYEKVAANLRSLDEKIARQPDSADLYFQRGSLYLSLYNRHAVTAEYRGVVYATSPGEKALADLDRAIQLSPSASAYYAARGKYYDYRWLHALSRSSVAQPSTWSEVKLLFWDDRSFAFAVKDYEKALTLATTTAETSQALSVLAWLYRTRATSTSFYPPAKIVSAEKQTRLVFEDFDRSLELTRKYLNASDKRTEWAFMIRDIYADKARAAIEFDENIAAVKILNDAISELHELQGDEVVCSLYILRGDVNQKLKEHDAAIRDYTYPIEKKYVNCDAIFEKRGDAFAAKGEWQRAIGDYSIELRKFTYPHVSLLTRRARAYLNTGDAGKAIVDLNEAMTYHKSCSQQYQLRAEAYRMLKDETRALEDENTAARYSRNKIGCSL